MSDAHVRNVLGALALTLADRIAQAGGADAAALVALHEYAGGQAVGALRRAVGLTHSGTVRLVDRLQARGLAVRGPGADGRTLAVALTPAGRAAARRALAAREAVLADAIAGLGEAERAALDALAGAVLARLTTGRESAWRTCRLCDTRACGHLEGRCPVTEAAAG